MNQKIIEELKIKLEKEKGSLEKELETFATKDPHIKNNWETKYPNRENGDKDEIADDAQEYDTALSLEYSLELKLRDVDTALEKIKDNKYGVCEKCEKQIEEERLKAVPEARLCIECKG